jgi:hypothetical protein
VLEATPMLGAVFGNTTGIVPGCEVSLPYKRIEFSSEIEYVFDTKDKNGSFLYSWDELVYSPTDRPHVGLAGQRTRAYHSTLDIQRGFSVGFSHKKTDFTTDVLNAGVDRSYGHSRPQFPFLIFGGNFLSSLVTALLARSKDLFFFSMSSF